jgi:hypothetical protein
VEHIVHVPDYHPGAGLRFSWDDDFEIAMSVSSTEVSIKANRAGLVTLARHLLTLAQDGVHEGAHLYMTADQEIDANVDLILERG